MEKKTVTRRDFLRFSGLTAAGLIVAACKPAEAPAQPTTAPAESTQAPGATAVPEATVAPAGEAVPVTIFVGFGTGTAPEQVTAEDALAAEYNAAQSDYKVQFMYTPYEDAVTKFTAMIAAGTAPELAMPIGIDGISWFLDDWMDIGPYIEKDAYDLTDFYGAAVGLHKYTFRNATFGLPGTLYPSFIFYNEELFDKAGLDYPTHKFGEAGWTYDKLEELALQLTVDSAGKKASESGFNPEDVVEWGYDESCQQGNNPRNLPMQWGAKHTGFSDDYKTALMNCAEWVGRWQWVSDAMWKKYYMVSDLQSRNFQADPLMTGKVAMFFCHTWELGEPYQKAEFAWNVAAVPAGPTGAIVSPVSADTFGIPKACKAPDAGWAVAKYMFSPEVLPRLCNIWNCLSARKSGAEDFQKAMGEKYPKMDVQVIFDAIGYIDVPPGEGWAPNANKVRDLIANTVGQIRNGDQKDAKAALEALNSDVQKAADEFWAQQG